MEAGPRSMGCGASTTNAGTGLARRTTQATEEDYNLLVVKEDAEVTFNKTMDELYASCGKDQWKFAARLLSYMATETKVLDDPRRFSDIQTSVYRASRGSLTTISLNLALRYLCSTLFFMVMNANELRHFAEFFEAKHCLKDEHVYHQGDECNYAYIIAEGSVNLFLETAGRAQFLASKAQGDMFGQSALQPSMTQIRAVTVSCAEPTTLLCITLRSYRDYLASPMTSYKTSMVVPHILEVQIESLVQKIDLLSSLNRVQLRVLGNLFRYVTVAEGDVVIKEGDLGSEMYVVVQGSLAVFVESSTGSVQLSIEDMMNGDYFGEIALIMNLPRTATVKATSRSLLLCLNKRDFTSFIDFQPGVKQRLSETVKQRIAMQFKRFKVPFFAAVPDERFHELAELADLIEFAEGERVFEEGDVGHFFYLVVLGSLTVSQKQEEAVVQLSQIGPGQYFGEMALLLNVPRLATVTANQRVVALTFSKQSFTRFFANNDGAFADFALRMYGSESPLEAVLAHALARDMFKKHVASEYSPENFDFWEAEARYAQLWWEPTQKGESPSKKGEPSSKFDRSSKSPSKSDRSSTNPQASPLSVSPIFFFQTDEESAMEQLSLDTPEHSEGPEAVAPLSLVSLAYRLTKATELCNTYIYKDSPSQVNLASHTVADIEKALARGAVSVNTFAAARKEILALMEKDSLVRFKKSPAFTSLLETVSSYDATQWSENKRENVEFTKGLKTMQVQRNVFNQWATKSSGGDAAHLRRRNTAGGLRLLTQLHSSIVHDKWASVLGDLVKHQ